jgi:hypothetical protein
MGRVDQHVGTAARFAESLVAFRCGKQVSAFIDAPAILRCCQRKVEMSGFSPY